jgi:ABC-type multidrug transport system ATPase subunit
MRQKLLIARALLHDPEVLFLDEPTTGLDAHMARHIREKIKKLRGEGKTIFLTTHTIEEAEELADRVAIIDRGKIIADRPPEELKAGLDRGSVEIAFKDGTTRSLPLADIDRIRDFVSREEIVSLTTRRPTLRDVFIALTGKDIDEEHTDSPR